LVFVLLAGAGEKTGGEGPEGGWGEGIVAFGFQQGALWPCGAREGGNGPWPVLSPKKIHKSGPFDRGAAGGGRREG